MIDSEKDWFRDLVISISSSYGIAYAMPEMIHWAIATMTAVSITVITHYVKVWLNKK